MRKSWVIKDLSRKLDEERVIRMGTDEQMKRERILKVSWDRSLGESISLVRIFERKDKLNECLRSERLRILRKS